MRDYYARYLEVLPERLRDELAEINEDYGCNGNEALSRDDCGRYLVFLEVDSLGLVGVVSAPTEGASAAAISDYGDGFLNDTPFRPLGVLDLKELTWCAVYAATTYHIGQAGAVVHRTTACIVAGPACPRALTRWYRNYADGPVPALWGGRA